MPRSSFAEIDCPIALAAEQLADKWKFVIIRNAFNGMTRFDDFAAQLGVASNVLTKRLTELVEAGIFEKTSVKNDGRAVDYRLTAKGHDLFPMLIFLVQWSDRWIKKEGGPRLNIASSETGEPGRAGSGQDRIGCGRHRQVSRGKRRPRSKSSVSGNKDTRRQATTEVQLIDRQFSFQYHPVSTDRRNAISGASRLDLLVL